MHVRLEARVPRVAYSGLRIRGYGIRPAPARYRGLMAPDVMGPCGHCQHVRLRRFPRPRQTRADDVLV
jgi:hypothetical protein